jgi:outer membrane protein assembly factor BamB
MTHTSNGGQVSRLVLAALVLVWAARPAAAQARAGQGEEASWPQFHGPDQNNRSADTGLLKRWPQGGPRRAWQAEGIGHGFSCVTIAAGIIYTTGNVGKETLITALDLSGKRLWQVANGPAYKREQPGTRSVPTLVGGRLYHMNADGDVVCLDAKTGKSVWGRNVLKDFAGRNIRWGLAESLLVAGGKVICGVGGPDVSTAALDAKTGKTVWTTRGVGDKPGYASAILVSRGGLEQIVTLTSASAIGVDLASGRLLWKVPHPAAFDENINQPVQHEGHVFTCTGHGRGGVLWKLRVNGKDCSVAPLWRNQDLDTQHGGTVLVDGHLYGHGQGGRGRWVCVDVRTGKTRYASKALPCGSGSLTWADGMLYAVTDRRGVALVRAGPKEFKPVSRFELPAGPRGPTWAHPVVCGGKLYLRHGDRLYAYDVAAGGSK